MFFEALLETQLPMNMVVTRYRTTMPRSTMCRFMGLQNGYRVHLMIELAFSPLISEASFIIPGG
jgi:hypothetical protein